MSALTTRGRIEIGVAAVTMAVGAFFLVLALGIRPGRFDPIGARALPLFLSCAILGLGLFIGLAGWRDRTPETALPQGYGFGDADMARVAQVIGAGLVYFVLFFALGYTLATAVAFALVLAAFGMRNAVLMLALALFGALLYSFVFLGLMGLNDPPGALVDLRWLSGAIIGN